MTRARRKDLRSRVKRLARWSVSAIWCGARHVAAADGDGLRILMYHDVSDAAGNNDPFCVATPDFRAQMKVLAEGYNVVSMDDAIARFARGEELPLRSVAITFDDGYIGVLKCALPALEEFNLPSTVYLRCDVLENGADPADHAGHRDYMTWTDVQTILARNMGIGAHGLTHRSLARIPTGEMQREIEGAKQRIETMSGTAVTTFAYPYGTGGDFNTEVVRITQEAGYLAALTAVNGANTSRTPRYALLRTKVERDDSLETFRRLLHGGMDPWRVVDQYAWQLQSKRKCEIQPRGAD